MNKPKINPLVLIGLIGMLTIGTNFSTQLYPRNSTAPFGGIRIYGGQFGQCNYQLKIPKTILSYS